MLVQPDDSAIAAVEGSASIAEAKTTTAPKRFAFGADPTKSVIVISPQPTEIARRLWFVDTDGNPVPAPMNNRGKRGSFLLARNFINCRIRAVLSENETDTPDGKLVRSRTAIGTAVASAHSPAQGRLRWRTGTPRPPSGLPRRVNGAN
jgi:hypothetical protein